MKNMVVNFISGGASTCMSVLERERMHGELFGLSETVAVVASAGDITGIANVQQVGFPKEHIHVVPEGDAFEERILEVLDRYHPNYFHQLGWMPKMPKAVLDRYRGLNQHLGPGGKWMYGVRRVYAHMRFCQEVQRIIPIEVFCQMVHSEYDAGVVICSELIDLDFRLTPDENAKMLLEVEHRVQIDGRREMAINFGIQESLSPPINIAESHEEEEILLAMKREARDKYPA